MDDGVQVVEGTGWIPMPGFGRINPRRDNVDGGRQFFTAYTDAGEVAEASGAEISGGPDTYQFEYDLPFLLADSSRSHCVELTISPLTGGRYAVRYRPSQWPSADGAW